MKYWDAFRSLSAIVQVAIIVALVALVIVGLYFGVDVDWVAAKELIFGS